jgi:undecaprenyl-diphosphatase
MLPGAAGDAGPNCVRAARGYGTYNGGMIRLIDTGDRKLMRRLNQWHAPKWVRTWMVSSTRAGDGWLWGALGIFLLFFGGSHRFAAAGAAGIAVVIGQILFRVMKHWIGRERPCATETHCWATLLPPDRFSFPSGHTITAFCAAVPIGLHYPLLMPLVLFCACSIAASRIVLGLHFLSDVVAGMLIGSGIGYSAFALVRGGL